MDDGDAAAATDRQGLEILDSEACWRLLEETPIGRVAFVDAGEPSVLPVSHLVVDHTVVFRTRAGAKLTAALLAKPVAFEVDRWDEATRTGWSVLVKGVAGAVSEADELARLEALPLEPWADAVLRLAWVRIRPDEITGRRILR